MHSARTWHTLREEESAQVGAPAKVQAKRRKSAQSTCHPSANGTKVTESRVGMSCMSSEEMRVGVGAVNFQLIREFQNISQKAASMHVVQQNQK